MWRKKKPVLKVQRTTLIDSVESCNWTREKFVICTYQVSWYQLKFYIFFVMWNAKDDNDFDVYIDIDNDNDNDSGNNGTNTDGNDI